MFKVKRDIRFNKIFCFSVVLITASLISCQRKASEHRESNLTASQEIQSKEKAHLEKNQQAKSSSVKLVNQWGKRGETPGEFIIPNGITILKNGTVLVVDCRNSRIQKFQKTGAFMRIIKPFINYKGLKPDEFKARLRWPEGICSDKKGLVWVVDTIRNHRAVQIDPHGKTLRYIGGDGNSTHGSGNDLGSFLWPHGVAVSEDGDVLAVSDTGNNRIQIFQTGRPDTPISRTLDRSRLYLMRVIGEFGKEPGMFSSPSGVSIDELNEVYVADYGNNRIQVFSQDGRFLRSFGKIGSGKGEFYHPYELALSRDGLLTISDYGNNRIQVFDKNGNFRFFFGRPGKGAGEFNGPTGMAFDEDNNLYVADAFNHRIQVFSFSPEAKGAPIAVNEEEEVKRRMDLTHPAFPGLNEKRSLTPEELGQWLAVEIYNDDNQYFSQKAEKRGYWGRGYYDWYPPFNTWSFHPLYRETAWRADSYIALHEITGEEEYSEIAESALNYLVSEQPEDGAYRWWNGEEPSSEGIFFVNGVVGEALALGYEHFKDPKYFEALRRICDWALLQPTDLTNTNYNSFLNHPLVLYYALSGEQKYLDKAVKLTLESISASIDEDGAMKDAHNRKTVYHYIILRGLMRLLSALPPAHKDYAQVESFTKRMAENLEKRLDRSGAFISSPAGAEPSKSPFIVAPVVSYCQAKTWLGWEVSEEKINAAISHLAKDSANDDDRLVIRDYLVYRYQTAKDNKAFCRELSKSLKKWRIKREKEGANG
jgi:DNA-binding beta-propeller fold protein YncE